MRAIERRDYLRLPDNMDVRYRVVSDEQMKHTTAEELFGVTDRFRLRRQLYKLELEARDIQRELANTDRALGSLAYNINRRFELVTQAAIGFNEPLNQDLIDMSAAGLACLSDTLLDSGTRVAVRLVGHHNTLGVACYGLVRYSLLCDDDRFRLGIQFMNLDPLTESLLTRHFSSLQADARRSRLLNPI